MCDFQDQGEPGSTADIPEPRLVELQHECYKALHCLYIAVDEEVASSVCEKVQNYIDALKREIGKYRTLLKAP